MGGQVEFSYSLKFRSVNIFPAVAFFLCEENVMGKGVITASKTENGLTACFIKNVLVKGETFCGVNA